MRIAAVLALLAFALVVATSGPHVHASMGGDSDAVSCASCQLRQSPPGPGEPVLLPIPRGIEVEPSRSPERLAATPCLERAPKTDPPA